MRQTTEAPRPPFYRRPLPIGLVAVAAAMVMLIWLSQSPSPKKLIMSVGNPGGVYQSFAKKYETSLARQGITLEIRESSGAVENYERMKDQDSEFDVAIIQSGIGDAKSAPHLQALAAVSYEPLWLFYRSDTAFDRLSQLSGKRIGIGIGGSGLHKITTDLLTANAVSASDAALASLLPQQAAERLRSGELDAAFFLGAPDTPVIAELLRSDLKLMHVGQADALIRVFPALSKIIYPRGAISLARDLPPDDVTLLSATSLLVAKDRLHPTLVYALLDTAFEVHGAGSFFSSHGEFPNQNISDFPLSDQASRYFKSGRPFLQNYLPFWLANFIEQRFVILVPLLAILFGLLQAVPRLIAYRIRVRLSHWYGVLKRLEDDLQVTATPTLAQLREMWQRITAIDASVRQISLPRRYLNQLYALKLSIKLVQDQIQADIDRAAHDG